MKYRSIEKGKNSNSRINHLLHILKMLKNDVRIVAAIRPKLNKKRAAARLQWTRHYRNWDALSWSRVIFSDASLFSLD